MSKIDDATRLRHMRDAALEAMNFVHNCTRADLDSDRMLTLALVKDIEIIGEAEEFPQIVKPNIRRSLGHK